MKPSHNILVTFGINGSLRKREVQAQPQASYTEYYLFNSAANLKAYSNNGLDFAYYGYNASNTRSYKLNFLNANSWVNGQQLPIHPQSIQAMFYPNAYMNFNHNGEYTKHYYNGSERIASRLGNTALSISMEMTDRLQERVGKLETRFQDDIRELVYTNVQVEIPPISATSLQQTGTPTDIYYYHTNHLGSTAFVTDQNQNVTQGFLYAPFGEITTEYNATFGSDIIPKYSFNAKELDEETGMYYYEARYYKPPVFTSRDPMFEKYFWMTPYAYCANNPVKYVDPTGKVIPFPVWAIGAALEYGFQVYDNYKDGKTGYDAWVKDIDFTDVIASALIPSGKYKVAVTMFEETLKATVDISINEGVKINRDVKDVAKKTVVNTVVGVEMGKVTKASSEKALQNANKEVNTARENLNRAKHKAQRSPNSTKKAENVRTAQNDVQLARNKQVRTQMMYYTVGQAPNATEYGVSALIKKSLEDKKATQQQVP